MAISTLPFDLPGDVGDDSPCDPDDSLRLHISQDQHDSNDEAPATRPAPARGAGRATGKGRPRASLKMQAIGYLSRREHSRQELRKKLLASLRQRAREDAAEAAASEAAAQALAERPANGIDDAFAPGPPPASPSQAMPAAGTRANPLGRSGRDGTRAPVPLFDRAPETRDVDATPSTSGRVVHLLRLASGDAIPARLHAKLANQGAPQGPQPHGEASGATSEPGAPPGREADLEPQDLEAVVDRLLDWLVANKYLSESRFVESRVNARARKQGALLIKHELARHGLALEPEQATALRETEFARALALWQRKFGEVASEPKARARQARFLASRAFAADVVRRIVGGQEES